MPSTGPSKAALDSGATDHFLPTSYQGPAHRPVDNGIVVNCANDTTMISHATDTLAIDTLPARAQGCHKFHEITIPLLSVKKFCAADLSVLFKGDQVTVYDAHNKVALLGELDPSTDLYNF